MHTAKECRENIEVLTPNTAACRICGQTYKRTYYYGKPGWQPKEDDNRLFEYIKSQKELEKHGG